MTRAAHSRVPFAVVGAAALVGLAITPPPPGEGQSVAPSTVGGTAGVEHGIAESMQRIERTKARKERTESEIEGLASEKKGVRERLDRRARALYRLSRAGMLPLAGGFPALLEHVGRIERLEQLVHKDLDALHRFDTRTKALRDEVRTLESTLEDAQASLDALQDQKADLEQQQAAAAQYAQAFQQSTFVPGQGAAAATGYPGGLDYGGIRVVDEPPTGLGSDFGALRGRLDLPVTGDFRVQDTDLGEGPALRFATAAGQPVRAAAEGRVAFSDQHGDYGRIVILDHGDSYYTVYGKLGRVDVRVGDYIGPRARIGTVGSSEGLIFEVRHRTRSLPPREWLGL